jgi:hypothetical protein
MRIASVGRAVFAATMIALGLLGLAQGDFAPIWQPAPENALAQAVLGPLSSLVALAGGLGLFWPRSAAVAARTLFACLLLWLLFRKAPFIVDAPLVEVSYQTCGETAVLVAGAWVLYASLATAWDKERVPFAVGDAGLHKARVLYALALIAFGLSHFADRPVHGPGVGADPGRRPRQRAALGRVRRLVGDHGRRLGGRGLLPRQRHGIRARRETQLTGRVVRGTPDALGDVGRGRHGRRARGHRGEETLGQRRIGFGDEALHPRSAVRRDAGARRIARLHELHTHFQVFEL